MIVGYVELSGDAPELAVREVEGAVIALGGRPAAERESVPGLVAVSLPDESALARLAGRLALARRTLVRVAPPIDPELLARREGAHGRTAAFRRLGRPGAVADGRIRALGRAYTLGGGAIDLDAPERRYWLAAGPGGSELLLRETAVVDRAGLQARRMPRLPFRRPVSLPPRLARAAANLAEIRTGDRVLDPFLGTGALLAEAALLGAKVHGIDADPAMVRGALRNFAHLGVEAESVVEGDARSTGPSDARRTFDAILTDPPYGRSSASFGAEPSRLVAAVLGRWEAAVVPHGRIVVLVPGGSSPLASPWVEECRVAVRVHRSLTREFRRYRRAA